MDRLSVDIDVNYVGAIEKEQMDAERPSLEDRIERLMARRATLHGASRPSTLAANGSTAMPPRWAGRNHRDRHQLSLPQPPLRRGPHAVDLLATLFGQFPFIAKLFADSAYQGPIFGNALAKILPGLETEIVKRSDQAKGFVRLPKRWIVERTIAWLNRCRRLAKDWENLNRNALAFLKLASIRLMVRKLCNP